MGSANLTEEFFLYLANILYEDPPRNLSDMIFFIKDFMENNPKISNQEIEEVSQKILT